MNPPPLAPGARVLVLWTDGRQYPATVQALAQGYAQVSWDSGGAPAWAPLHVLSPLLQQSAPPPSAAPSPAWQPHPAYARQAPAGQPAQGMAPQQGIPASMQQQPPASLPQPQPLLQPQPVQQQQLAQQPVPAAPRHQPPPQPPVATPAPQSAPQPRPPQVVTPAPAPSSVAAPQPRPLATPAPSAAPLVAPAASAGPPPRPMAGQIRGLPRGLVYEPTGQGPGSGKAFFFLFGFCATSDADVSMRMTDIDHIGDDVAALRAAGFRVLVDLHGDLDVLSAALSNKHPDAGGAPTAGVFWGGHGADDGTIDTYDGGVIAPEKLPSETPQLGTVKLFVMSACHAGAHQARWQKALGQQAMVIGWGAPITNERAIQFLTPDESSSKGFDDLLERQLGVKRVQADGPLVEVKRLATEHEDRLATLNLSFDELIAEVGKRLKCQLDRGKGGEAYFTVRTPPSKDYPDKPRAQTVRVGPMGSGDSWILISSLVGPYSDALDMAKAMRVVTPALHIRVALATVSPNDQEFVLVETIFRRRRLDPQTLSVNIISVGIYADKIEDMFFGSDRRLAGKGGSVPLVHGGSLGQEGGDPSPGPGDDRRGAPLRCWPEPAGVSAWLCPLRERFRAAMKIRAASCLVALAALASAPLVGSLVGCSGQMKLEAKAATEAPKPPPPKDTDGDGIADNMDKCIDVKEDGLEPDPKDGCPTDDPDKDGIRGEADKCPDKPETVNGYQDEDGCPDEKPKVELTDKEIKINDKILFHTGSATIDPQSDKLIEDIAKVFKEHPEIQMVEVAGHADKRGSDISNKLLTQQRSEAVAKRLVSLGVGKERVRASGFGSFCPIDSAENEAAFEKNRRVEFVILRKDGKDLDAKWGGCEEAQKKGMKPAPLPKLASK